MAEGWGARYTEVAENRIGVGVIAQAVLSIIVAEDENLALKRFMRLLYLLPEEEMRKALAAMSSATVPEEEVERIRRAVEEYDLSEAEADRLLEALEAHYKLQAGLAAVGGYLRQLLLGVRRRLSGEGP